MEPGLGGQRMLAVGTLHAGDRCWLERVAYAQRVPDRMRGLLGCTALPAGRGLIIDPCNSIHMIGMRFALDVIFLDRDWRVTSIHRDIRPGRLMLWGARGSRRVLELTAGTCDLAAIEPGCALRWEPQSSVASMHALG